MILTYFIYNAPEVKIKLSKVVAHYLNILHYHLNLICFLNLVGLMRAVYMQRLVPHVLTLKRM